MASSSSEINAFPAKRFFVEMLTRDIELQDAILDLLDNCLDGVLRSNHLTSKQTFDNKKVYEGYYAHINFDESGFSIVDNCGGIPAKLAASYAFKLGRPSEREAEDVPTIGVYGIGMKRAIFKMGTSAKILSKTEKEEFKVVISPEWMSNDNSWLLDLETENVELEKPGVKIIVDQLRKDVRLTFSKERGFESTLINVIANHYSIILNKGFEVKVNGNSIKPNITSLIFDKDAIQNNSGGIAPYFYKGEYNGVSIDVAVGFYRNLITEEEEENLLSGKTTTERAGFTIICNDRVVLHADKTRLTGWGDTGVPQYHTQFIGIAGVVVFSATDAVNLPITTTKRGIDGNSEVYLSTKVFMKEGLKFFTDFTYKWKSNSAERKEIVSDTVSSLSATDESFTEIVPESSWSKVHRSIGGKVFRPKLPMPKDTDPLKQIKFSRRLSEIKEVSEFIFDDETRAPTEVGQFCFDNFLQKAKK